MKRKRVLQLELGMPDYADDVHALHALMLDIVTYDKNSGLNERNYQELRKRCMHDNSWGVPAILRQHGTAATLRAAAQGKGGYQLRRDWVNGEMAEYVDGADGIYAPLSLLPVRPVVAPAPSGAEDLFASMHPDIVSRCQAIFETTDYDTAISKAYKRVEVRIRELGQFAPTDLGVSLVTKAMALRGDGAVITLSDVASEQEGYQQLFRGAIACFKNPLSHHEVGHSSRAEALEMLGTASLLLRLLDRAKINLPTNP